ncbi:hypothetical protein PHIM7_324 [Sinorhizobium phage phiM7]|uniref:Uncharacterized protein n=3 Tax=Emdodecavirus TaxID=1980937 RepID=S5M7J4_9CAUD|nr:hypothetical protein AB690_gp190 [Sinorhizobium phage phiM12]YP_009212569.1 hypothetical protein AVT40_gp204 [Sinorhizobium phage phiN3]YP_009601449.1 hypothetical protein FDH46_gp154 [Sinorhizobium phage phiM7]AKF13229.1 hypothetical protein PHIM19_324 [Sinorhizobium phage phiM19]AGR48046.1 hypothetical protein SmphiM12_414 [Sinorhizobium phage phiM12]AKF12869.1 hypothetical protein PHIM7_324 [Sinorhizobium phage phiM7]AKF13592.1 hypothetical protein PHIN3_329 [Sinorhizobium phage phiN3]
MNLQEIEQLQNAYIDGLIKFSRSQKKFWRKVPYLAARCQGNGGYSDQYSYAIREGYWRVGGRTGYGSYHYRVDCATGNICDWTLTGDHTKPTKFTKDLIMVLPHELNAEKIFEELLIDSQKPVRSLFKTEAQVRADQDELIEKYGITPIYKRK